MNDNINTIEDLASTLLSNGAFENLSEESIIEAVRKMAKIVTETQPCTITDEDIKIIVKRLEERFEITMSLGALFTENYKPWLDDARGGTNWYYWNRYKRYLGSIKIPPLVIQSLDIITDQILDHLEDPTKEGKWARKGLVFGHVQSGKTSNYTGLINKAADCGYRVIIVLAGTLNSLRNQTQFRLDGGFIGTNTELKLPLGVGLISSDKKPAYFTTNSKDFKKSIATQIGVGIADLREPVILVIKKNKSTLENLIDWLKHNNRHNLKNHPMLIIDDEADHASINTNKEGEDATTINKKIRELIHLFDRSSYLGYTATPFANIFIDPDTETEMLGDDLFPRDFIISLDPPSNYVGPSRIFSFDADLDIVRVVDDYELILPRNHKKNWGIEELPQSLKEAIKIFILSRTIRILRGQNKAHNSMMINITRFTNVQSKVRLLVDEYVKEVSQSIANHYKLNPTQALENHIMRSLKKTYDAEFPLQVYSWDKIQRTLKESVSPIGIIEVNSSSSATQLDYSDISYPNGRNVIAIGGLSLSRGLTLEGLTVSYFLRNSIMYDTLMQMGRWFGYRDGYADICRLYMTGEAYSWYEHISIVVDELRDEFKRMQLASMTPKDFGLCVRSHPESLIVTARNKMQTGKSVLRQVSLAGRLVETTIVPKQKAALKDNFDLLVSVVNEMLQYSLPLPREEVAPGYLWVNIPVSVVLRFIKNFNNHPASQLTNREPLGNHIAYLEKNGWKFWDVVLISPQKTGIEHQKYRMINNLQIFFQTRGVSITDNGIAINKGKRRVGYASQESIGLPRELVKQVELEYKKEYPNSKTTPGSRYRKLRWEINGKPLLILHLLDCEVEKGKTSSLDDVTAYGISFPGDPGNKNPDEFVEYVVNTTWWQNEYTDILDEDELEDD